MTDRTTRTFVLLGASGLVGGHLLGLLAADPAYAGGTLLGRRASGLAGPAGSPDKGVAGLPDGVVASKVREVVVDFDHPSTFREYLATDDVFCCLGTTIKKAGSQEAFRRVDCDIPASVGREARAAGARQFLIVTAVGADAKSSVFYNRVKGEVEAALAAFEFPAGLKIFRPSLIVGERGERRPAERVAMALMAATRPLFAGGLTRYRAIDAAAVARAMRASALEPVGAGVRVYEGKRLFASAAAG
jgi:uncharacterized protein YbjT (DUF2867 family)